VWVLDIAYSPVGKGQFFLCGIGIFFKVADHKLINDGQLRKSPEILNLALTFTDFEMLLNKLSKVDLDPSFGFCLAL